MGQRYSVSCLSIEEEMDDSDLVCGTLYVRSMEEASKKTNNPGETDKLIKNNQV